jgi:ParB-like chromosome segregation protein Spo0J
MPSQRQPDRIEVLPLDRIRLDFQSDPDCLNEETVVGLVAAFRRGDKIEPVRIFFDGTTYWLADGFHRVAAARQLGYRGIEAEVVLGTHSDMEAEWREGLEAVKQMLRTPIRRVNKKKGRQRKP